WFQDLECAGELTQGRTILSGSAKPYQARRRRASGMCKTVQPCTTT
ncbi:unnamed protein product, partial [Ectocarpus sp. 6 AP-2014]